ncbi:hypothetical protein LTR86_002551 [Recurvomyces mirabilis]|nr:hypothetical protein LTR86_002551 [Recurvomyces mirabilis]
MFSKALLRFPASINPAHKISQSGRLAAAIVPAVRYRATATRSFSTTPSANDDTNGNGQLKKRLLQRPSAIAQRLPDPDVEHGPHRLREFELDGRVFIVTGGAQGLGLTLAEALVEAGGHVYCLDRQAKPQQSFYDTQERLAHRYEGTLHYRQVDVQCAKQLDDVVAAIATEHQRLDGLIANAGVQHVCDAIEYKPDDVMKMMAINFGGVFFSAQSCARQMIKYNIPGSMVLIGSMSGLIANRGLRTVVYNASKAAVIQSARSLAMEWGKIVETEDGMKPIRVNTLSPGNIMTPMVQANFDEEPHLKKMWEDGNMLGRLSEMREFRGAALFLLSDASSFMTGGNLVIDGGYTAW